jgi:hypothetical protein
MVRIGATSASLVLLCNALTVKRATRGRDADYRRGGNSRTTRTAEPGRLWPARAVVFARDRRPGRPARSTALRTARLSRNVVRAERPGAIEKRFWAVRPSARNVSRPVHGPAASLGHETLKVTVPERDTRALAGPISTRGPRTPGVIGESCSPGRCGEIRSQSWATRSTASAVTVSAPGPQLTSSAVPS